MFADLDAQGAVAPFERGGVLRRLFGPLQFEGDGKGLGGDVVRILGKRVADLLRNGAVGIQDGADPVRDLEAAFLAEGLDRVDEFTGDTLADESPACPRS